MSAVGWRDMTRTDFRPILCVDFDGVINPYSRGWQGGTLYETATTPGFWPWLETVSERFDVVIHSSRFAGEVAGPPALASAKAWLQGAWLEHCRATDKFACSLGVFDALHWS